MKLAASKRDLTNEVPPEPVPTPEAAYRSTPIAFLRESPTNPRKTWGELEELAESVRKVGILQPLLATPADDQGVFTLVFGHRRFRAAKLAGLEEVPVLVRAMTDEEVLEAQVVENCARNDVHPLEEAEGYERLHRDYGMSVDDIGAKVGKSRAAIYARMKLLALSPPARKAFYDGLLTPSTALYVARIPHADLQKDALAQLTKKDYRGELPSARAAFEIVSNRYMLKLAAAPFDRGDADLVPAAGACKDCPKRTGNQKELFADVGGADVCTDPKCWETKRLAGVADKAASLEAKGVKVVTGQPTADYHGGTEIQVPAGYAKLDEYDYQAGGKIRDVLKRAKIEPKPVIMFDSKGNTIALVRKADIPKRAPSGARNHGDSDAKWKQQQKVSEAKAKAENLVVEAILGHLRKGIDADQAWRWAAAMVTNRFGGDIDKKTRGLKGAALVAHVFKLGLKDDYGGLADDNTASMLVTLADAFKIDWRAIRAAEIDKVKKPAKVESKAKAVKPKPKAEKKKAAKAPKKKK